jgi:hypothetical protein
MKTMLHLSLILIFAACIPLSAQIVIEPEDIPNEPETIMPFYNFNSEDGIEIDLGEAGEDQVWDFIHLMFPDINEDEVIDPEEAQFIDDFEDVNRVLRSSDSGFGLDIDGGLRYEELNNNGWNLLGVELPEDQDLGVPIEFIQFPDPVRILPMPAEFGDRWNIESSVTMTIEAPDEPEELAFFDSLDVTFNIEGSGEIDAWGTLIYPDDEVEILRAYITGTGNVTAVGVRHIFGRRVELDVGEVFSFPTTHTYKWYTQEFGEVLSITSLPDEEEPNFESAAIVRVRMLDDTEHFTEFTRTAALHRLIITSIEIGGEPVPAGWEIGIFTPEDGLGGAGVWRETEKIGIPAYMGTEEIAGFEEGDEFSFTVWDPEEDAEWQVNTMLEDGPEVWNENGLTILSLEGEEPEYDLTVSFSEGWNLISMNIIPPEEFWEEVDGPDVVLLTEQLRSDDGHLIQTLKDEIGRFYAPSFNFCNIPYWDLAQGYLVNVDEAIRTVWSGESIAPDEDILIEEGWNFIAYYPSFELDAGAPDFYVLSPVIDNVIIAKDEMGRFLSPEFGFSNMLPWRESEGYQIRVDADVVLNYPAEREGLASAPLPSKVDIQSHWEALCSTGENMSLLVTLNPGSGDQVAAFNSENWLVGVGTVDGCGRCGLAVWGDDDLTDAVDGLIKGEIFTLKFWSSTLNTEVDLEPDVSGLVYETDGFAIISATILPTIPDQYYLSQNYPNPFNSTTILPYGLPETSQLSISIYDMSGRLVEILVNGNIEAGYHTAIWEASTVATGVYLVKMETASFNSVRKVILVR